MTTRVVVIFSLLLIACSLNAGEKPPVHFTGNIKVDFFGNTPLAPYQPAISPGALAQNEMLGETSNEKSPWLAGFLSLAVPGAGEVYTENYLKGALFFAADVAAWALAFSYDKKGDRQTDEFQLFANQHWSAVRYANWTLDNIDILTNGRSDRTQYEDIIFDDNYDPDNPCGPPFRCIEWAQLNAMEDSIGHYSGVDNYPPNGYTHRLPYYGEQQYFELIGKYDEYSRGWDDADLSRITADDLPIKSNSARYYEYAKMRAQANDYYDVAGTWVKVAVLNHIISAADAYWSATKYNKALRAEAKMRMQPSPFGMVPVTEIKLKYIF